MPTSVNVVYNTLKDLVNKDQQGFVTVDEFNRFAQVAQIRIYNRLFDTLKSGSRLARTAFAQGRDKSKYKQIEEDLAIFAKSSDHMYFAASTSKGFRFRPNGGATSASAGVTIASDGDVGIGTTGPANKLDVYGSLAVGSSYVGVSAPSDGVIIEGNVGIGTSSVSNKLDVA